MNGTLIWITGLAGSGKSTIGKSVYEKWRAKVDNVVFLDGDHFREIMGSTGSHTREARFKVAFQIAGLCKFLTQQGINVVCSTISLFAEVHEYNRSHNANYIEVFVDCPMDELIRRDQKGLYSQALKGEIENVVGVDMAFDKPVQPNIIIDNSKQENLDVKAESILNLIYKKNETR